MLEGDRVVGVRTGDGVEHHAAAVVLAAGSWSAAGWLPPEARAPVRPVKGQILTLRGPESEPVCERIVASERVYMVPRGDGTLVVGATVEERGFDRRVTAGAVYELLREAYRALPDVAELELVGVEAGLRPGTPDNAPLIGPGSLEGLVLATGHYRKGILLAPITADAVVALLAGEFPAEARAADPARPIGRPRRGSRSNDGRAERRRDAAAERRHRRRRDRGGGRGARRARRRGRDRRRGRAETAGATALEGQRIEIVRAVQGG